MPNVHCIISGHNKTIRDKTLQTDTSADRKITKCYCRDRNSCPLSNICLTSSVVYQTTVTKSDTNKKQTYVGHTEGKFKTRFNTHTSSFRNPKYKHATELSKYVWNLKEKEISYSIKWRILKKCKSYSNKTKRCNLCLHEKFLIIYHPHLCSLNSRHELLSKCRHGNKFLLSNHKTVNHL